MQLNCSEMQDVLSCFWPFPLSSLTLKSQSTVHGKKYLHKIWPSSSTVYQYNWHLEINFYPCALSVPRQPSLCKSTRHWTEVCSGEMPILNSITECGWVYTKQKEFKHGELVSTLQVNHIHNVSQTNKQMRKRKGRKRDSVQVRSSRHILLATEPSFCPYVLICALCEPMWM